MVDAPGKDGNASMPEQVKRPNPWMMMMMMMIQEDEIFNSFSSLFRDRSKSSSISKLST
jgi:hypothetical protein